MHNCKFWSNFYNFLQLIKENIQLNFRNLHFIEFFRKLLEFFRVNCKKVYMNQFMFLQFLKKLLKAFSLGISTDDTLYYLLGALYRLVDSLLNFGNAPTTTSWSLLWPQHVHYSYVCLPRQSRGINEWTGY